MPQDPRLRPHPRSLAHHRERFAGADLWGHVHETGVIWGRSGVEPLRPCAVRL
jgi:hypothetical protein